MGSVDISECEEESDTPAGEGAMFDGGKSWFGRSCVSVFLHASVCIYQMTFLLFLWPS